MPRCKVHHHPCQTCGKKTECGGVYEENYDGWPEVICREFHLANGELKSRLHCRDCNERELAAERDALAAL